MRFINLASLLTKLGKSHSKKLYERFVHEDVEINMHYSKKKKTALSPKGSIDLYVGKEEKKYPVPVKYFVHPKLRELLKEYQDGVFDSRFGDPIVLECSTETFDQLLH